MSETQATETEQQTEQSKTYTQEEFQAKLDAAIKERLSREKKKFADYEDLKAKAAKLDEIEEANKTELEKANDTIAELTKTIEARKSEDERNELVNRIAEEHKVPADYRCFLTANDEDGLVEQAEKLAEKFAEPSFNEGKPQASINHTGEKSNGEVFAEWIGEQL